MQFWKKNGLVLLGTMLPLCAMAAGAGAEYALNLQTPASNFASEIFDLHNMLLIVCFLIMVPVFAVIFWSIIHHRKSKGVVPAKFHESMTVEVIWTVIPLLIVFGLSVLATKAVFHQYDTSAPDVTIKVTGVQWKWQYDYLNDGLSFYSTLATPSAQINNTEAKGKNYLLEVDQPLVVPVNKKIRLLLTAGDVIHNWWVPAFAVKQDAIPGKVTDAWFEANKIGVYRGDCAELCGKNHAYMPIVVEVKSDADYKIWLEEQKKKIALQQDDPNKVWALEDIKARGEKVYANNCAACHGDKGQGASAPSLDGSPVANGAIEEHLAIVLQGKNGTRGAMPAWSSLNDTEIAAVVTFERNSWANKKGDMLQPSEVAAKRK